MIADKPITPKPKGMNAHEIKYALHKMFPAKDGWLTVEELFIHGFDRYIDLWALRVDTINHRIANFRFRYLSVHAIEIKVTRADFNSEMKEPAKRLAAQSFSNYFSFAAPRGIIDPDELPRGIGLIEFRGSKPKFVRDPEFTRVEPPRWELIAALGRSILKG